MMSLVIDLVCMGCIAASALSASPMVTPPNPAPLPPQITETAPPNVTASTKVNLNSGASAQVETLTVYGELGYWKIHVINNSKSTTRISIRQGSPHGEQVGSTLLTPSGTERDFTSPEDSPLASGVYYLDIQTDGNNHLSGALYYKCGDTYESMTR